MAKKKVSKDTRKKFRFPRGIRQVIIPSVPPIGLDEIARQKIESTIARFAGFPKGARIRIEYRYSDGTGIIEAQIYKGV